MNALIEQQNQGLAVSERTADLIKAGVSTNTLKAYRHALEQLATWLADGDNGFCVADIVDKGNGERGLGTA